MGGDVKFEGPGPFHLPVAQSTAAVPHHNNGVTVIFQCALPGRGSRPEPVNVQMLTKTARTLAEQLMRAVTENEGRDSKV